jgi:hypothetical protein
MPINRIAFGTPREASHPDALRAALAEFISMLIFVFAGSGSGMAFSKISTLIICFYCFAINFIYIFLLKIKLHDGLIKSLMFWNN